MSKEVSSVLNGDGVPESILGADEGGEPDNALLNISGTGEEGFEGDDFEDPEDVIPAAAAFKPLPTERECRSSDEEYDGPFDPLVITRIYIRYLEKHVNPDSPELIAWYRTETHYESMVVPKPKRPSKRKSDVKPKAAASASPARQPVAVGLPGLSIRDSIARVLSQASSLAEAARKLDITIPEFASRCRSYGLTSELSQLLSKG